MLSLSLGFEYLLVFHRVGNAPIFLKSSHSAEFDAEFLDNFRRAFSGREIALPEAQGQISPALFAGKYVLTRRGKYTDVVVIAGLPPIRIAHDALHTFCVRMESRWAPELEELYTAWQGDIALFSRSSPTRVSLDQLAEEIFRLEFTRSHRIGPPTGDLSGNHRLLVDLALNLSKERGGILALRDLLGEARPLLKGSDQSPEDLILDLITRQILLPA